MLYSMQNNETGEVDYLPHIPHSINKETGEVNFIPVTTAIPSSIESEDYDKETGEPQIGIKQDCFHVPRRYLRGTLCDQFNNDMSGMYDDFIPPVGVAIFNNADAKCSKDEKNKKPKYKPDDYINMEGVKTEIITGHKKANYRVFLIPTLFCFNIYLALLVAVFESLLHFWSHKTNDLNMNKQIYFRSPLHVLTSQFCGRCRLESEALQITSLHDNMTLLGMREKTLKHISKVIS